MNTAQSGMIDIGDVVSFVFVTDDGPRYENGLFYRIDAIPVNGLFVYCLAESVTQGKACFRMIPWSMLERALIIVERRATR